MDSDDVRGWRVLGGRYRLLETIGEGGMAVVHRGMDELLDREVAIKVLRPQFAADPDFVARFRAEARNAAGLAHPNIVPIFDTGVDGGTEYIVMQLVDGADLESVLGERGRLPVAEALRIGVAAAEALAAAHARGIVHRDIKPGNILLNRDGDVRVVDFGIARALGDARTTTAGLMLGSVQYCSPEQVLGEPVGPSSDVFSLGALLYELITGQRAWDGDSPAAVALARVREAPVPPSQLVPELPAGIDELVLRALARQPEDRYPSADAVAEAIRGWWRTHRASQAGVDPRRAQATARRRGGSTGRFAIPGALAAAGVGAGAATLGAAGAAGAAAPARAAGGAGAVTATGAGVHPDTSASAATTAVPAADPGADLAATRAVPTAGAAGVPADPWAREDARRRRRRAAGLPPWLIPAALGLGVVAILLAGLTQLGRMGGVGTATGTPGSQVAVLPSPSASPTPAATPSVTVAPTPSPTATPTPPPTPVPATPAPTPVPATPAPTPRPATPAPQPPAQPSAGPASIVAAFYRYVAEGRFREAEALWTAEMRQRYPASSNIDGRFSETERIVLNRNETVQQDADSAYVEIDMTEYQTDETRRYVGGWDLVLTQDGWRLHDPDLSQVQ